MGDRTAIEWTDVSLNPIRARNKGAMSCVGWHCEKVSEACRNCYAESMNKRLGTGLDYKPGNLSNVEIFLDEKMLLAPLRWKKPRKIFVCSTTDLFGDWVEDEWLAEMFGVMAVSGADGPFHRETDGERLGPSWRTTDGRDIPTRWPNMKSGPHIFQILTKRPKRMRELLSSVKFTKAVSDSAYRHAFNRICAGGISNSIESGSLWPLPNVWIGVTAENQEAADERIPDLLATPAAVRFVSVEPMLGPVNLRSLSFQSGNDLPEVMRVNEEYGSIDALRGISTWPCSHYMSPTIARRAKIENGTLYESKGDNVALDWVITGGESGPHARPTHPDWERSIRDQCATAGVAYFRKQAGEYAHDSQPNIRTIAECMSRREVHVWPDGSRSYRVGKRRAGRLLDGVEHSAFPALSSVMEK